MNKLEELYEYADLKNIKIKKFTDKENKLNGTCFCGLKNCKIYLNTAIKTETEKKCVLAEEIGHYETGIIETNFNDTDEQSYLLRSINEFRAKKWAVNKLIPFKEFKRFLGSNFSKFEVANELGVTEEILDIACYVYEPLLYN